MVEGYSSSLFALNNLKGYSTIAHDMKLHPPKPNIDLEKPFQDALFGREAFAQSLTALLRNLEDPLVIFINAPWGAGKTTFCNMWQASLRQQKLDVIYFDSYAADYFDDPFVSFSGEILELLKKRFPDEKSLVEQKEFKETAVEVGKRLAGLATKIGLRAATLGAVEVTDLKELKEMGSEIATGFSEIGAAVVEKKIAKYGDEKDALKRFTKSLQKVAAKIREEQGFPLTIIVDELDRCRPTFALALLERIKHLFDVENVAFVLLVSRDQIESYIKIVYGDVDVRGYLFKFGTLFLDLPVKQPETGLVYIKGHDDYCNTLMNHYGFGKRTPNTRFLSTCIGHFALHFRLTLRELEKVFAVLSLYYASLNDAGHNNSDLMVALLATLKVKRPDLYNWMREGHTSAQKFYEETGLDIGQVKSSDFNHEWAKNLLDCCLMSDAEFKKATEKTEGGNVRMGLSRVAESMQDRKRVIAYFASELDRFGLPPS